MQEARAAFSGDVPLLHTIENISHAAPLAELRKFFASGGKAASFRVYIDDACAQPSDWRTNWEKPRQWGLTGEKNWPTKYAAAGFLPIMLARSPFVTDDWRRADASLVVSFARQYAGGPAIIQQQCLQRLRARSLAWRATNGSRHFFIFTDSRGPCCLDGKYKDVDFLRHHVIGPHGEPGGGARDPWFFRRGRGPRIRCFDDVKDVNIPTPNIHFPRLPLAPTLPPVPAGGGPRPLLLFYAGWNYGERMKLVNHLKDDPDVYVRQKVPPDEYKQRMLSARFCPVCGGTPAPTRPSPSRCAAPPAPSSARRSFRHHPRAAVAAGFSQWTPRLAEALYYECVPVLLSPHHLIFVHHPHAHRCVPVLLSPYSLPPWSHVLDWPVTWPEPLRARHSARCDARHYVAPLGGRPSFSLRLDPKRIKGIKGLVQGADYARLAGGVRRAKAALTYQLDGWTGADMLPLLLWEMVLPPTLAPPPSHHHLIPPSPRSLLARLHCRPSSSLPPRTPPRPTSAGPQGGGAGRAAAKRRAALQRRRDRPRL
jgi:hypothetical protein